jgi:hypothetical protein
MSREYASKANNLNTQTQQTTNPQGLATLILIRNQPYDLKAQRPDGGTVTLRIQIPGTGSGDVQPSLHALM